MIDDQLKGKKVIVGVTGGIAAYKACMLVRQLISRGAEVRVLMTPAATQFITPLTLSTLSGNDVLVSVFPHSQEYGAEMKTWHIEYGIWADIMIVAPATINTIAKIVYGFADNALTTVVQALRGKLLFAPAADMDMYNQPSNMENLKKLEERGAFIVHGEEGFLASGLIGPGRMADVNKIIDAAELILADYKKDMIGKKVLVTAGPTFEDIDPVRFIGNRSSGKMGFELAKAAFLRGADVTLISGPTNLKAYPEIKRIDIRSAEEMEIQIKKEVDKNDVLIMSAAVADYKPESFTSLKIKKEDTAINIPLVATTDILASLKDKKITICGFALETDNEIENAKKKLSNKNMDLIVLNSLQEKGAGFEFDTNKITVINKNNEFNQYPLMSKFQTANVILKEINKIGN